MSLLLFVRPGANACLVYSPSNNTSQLYRCRATQQYDMQAHAKHLEVVGYLGHELSRGFDRSEPLASVAHCPGYSCSLQSSIERHHTGLG